MFCIGKIMQGLDMAALAECPFGGSEQAVRNDI